MPRVSLNLQLLPPAWFKPERDAVGVSYIRHSGRAHHALFQPAAELPPLCQRVAIAGKVELVKQDVIGVEAGIDLQCLAKTSQKKTRAHQGNKSERNLTGHEHRTNPAAAGMTAAAARVQASAQVE